MPETAVPTTYPLCIKCRKRKCLLAEDGSGKNQQHPVEMTSAELLPLQQEVSRQQLNVFSAQLELIEEQQDYYSLKRQGLLKF